jgi:Rieske Fe-S protein
MTTAPCKGCRESVHISEEQLNRMLKSLSAHPEQCVGEEEYERRLSLCSQCPSLVYDTTCMHCGCVVALRAKMKEKACPYPLQPRW